MVLNAVASEVIDENDFYIASNTLCALLLSFLALLYIYWKVSRKHLIELAEKLPGPQGYPIIGNALDFIGTNADVFSHTYQLSFKYTQLARFWIGPKLLIFLIDPKDVELILSSHVHIDKASEYSFFKPWLGDGLLISTGDKWRRHRKLITPTFHLNVLKTFIDLFNTNSKAVVKKLMLEEGKTFDCHDYMSETTVEMLLETAMGVNKNTQNNSGFEYAMAVIKMCDILHLRHRKLWLRPNWIFNLSIYGRMQRQLLNTIHGLTRRVIKKRKLHFKQDTPVKNNFEKHNDKDEEETLTGAAAVAESFYIKDDLDVDDNDVGEKKRSAFLDLLLETAQNGEAINDEEIKEEVDTIMFEGHDTTAAASSFFLSLMGIHQEIQDNVIDELNIIFGDSDRPASFNDTLKMKYLERCLLETLRLYPPVPIIARQLKEDVKLASSNNIIPAGCTVVIGTFKVHRREDIYLNPNKFDPDNFLPEKMANRPYYAFIPFSAGPRSCVGRKYAILKLKILLSTILRNYRVVSDIKEEDFQLQADIILKRSEGFPIRLIPRKLITAPKT